MNALLQPALVRPRIGFLGVGWIGRMRLHALAESGVAEIAAIADAHAEAVQTAAASAPAAYCCDSIEGLLERELDGIVIATPSGAHAQQAITALKHGLAVFCQKPLTRTAAEAHHVIDTARHADRLIEVDFCYQLVSGVSAIRSMVQNGELGDVYAIDLTFHNAYGPDKPWFYDLSQSGGGCVMDLGSHLVDLALWISGCGDVDALHSELYAQGRRLTPPIQAVEDYATAQWRLSCGASVRMTCSWRLNAGCDAVIEAAFYGTRGGAALRNVGGSFYNFNVERFDGTRRRVLAEPPDAWGGRTLVRWAERLAAGERFDPAAERFVDVARIVDRIYGR